MMIPDRLELEDASYLLTPRASVSLSPSLIHMFTLMATSVDKSIIEASPSTYGFQRKCSGA